MEILSNLAAGFIAALEPTTVLALVAGVAWGVFGGAVPGISSATALALVLPFTFAMAPTAAIVLLVGVLTGANYGSSISAILIATPGTPASIATVIDGNALHKRGRSGKALGISLYSGVIAGLVTSVLLVVIVLPLAEVALRFGPVERFAVMVFGLSAVTALGGQSVVRTATAAVLGLMLATVGRDLLSSANRFTFGNPNLLEGFGLIPVLVGVFAFPELFSLLRKREEIQAPTSYSYALPDRDEVMSTLPATGIGSFIGLIVGIMPGAGGTIAGIIAWNESRRWSKSPDEYGKGSLSGIAAPEAANNADVQGALVPLLALGIPGDASSAVLLAAFVLHGLQPGPLLFDTNPEVVYGLLAALFLAQIAMLVIGLGAIRVAIKTVSIPPAILFSGIAIVILAGAYAQNRSMFDVGVTVAFGLIGVLMARNGYSLAAFVLGFVLGGLAETNFRQGLTLSLGDPTIFLTSPISAVLLMMSAAVVAYPLIAHALARSAGADRAEGSDS